MRGRFVLLVLSLLLVSACHGGPTEPKNDTTFGRLAGTVTIGPFCPVAQPTPCPTPPSAYSERKVLVYNDAGSQLLATVDIDTLGAYLIAVPPGNYVVDVKKLAGDRVAELPKSVTIQKNLTTVLNINIDTGIR
jgi:hypothetical protein